jgi:hypothetical protein
MQNKKNDIYIDNKQRFLLRYFQKKIKTLWIINYNLLIKYSEYRIIDQQIVYKIQ